MKSPQKQVRQISCQEWLKHFWFSQRAKQTLRIPSHPIFCDSTECASWWMKGIGALPVPHGNTDELSVSWLQIVGCWENTFTATCINKQNDFTETIAVRRPKSWLQKHLQRALFICQKKAVSVQCFWRLAAPLRTVLHLPLQRAVAAGDRAALTSFSLGLCRELLREVHLGDYCSLWLTKIIPLADGHFASRYLAGSCTLDALRLLDRDC